MITLAASDTLAGGASAASMLTSTIFGMEYSTSAGEVYKVLDQRQLAASPATIYTVPASTTTFIKSIMVVNNDSVPRTAQYFRGGTVAANALTAPIVVPNGGWANYEDGIGWQVFNNSGQLLIAYGPYNPLDNWGINGSKAETMDRVYCAEINTTVASTGQIYLQAIWISAGTIVSNISVCSATTAAGTPTHYCFALYDANRNLLASTADQTSTAWAANTLKTLAVTSAYTVPTSGLYYIAFMCVATTVPTVKGATARTDGTLSFTAPAISGVSGTTYTTGTAPATVTAIGAKVTTSMWACVT